MRPAVRLTLLSSLFFAGVALAQPTENPALYNYVNRDDGAYNYSIARVLRNPLIDLGGGRTRRVAADVFFMNLTSQEWNPTANLSAGFQENRQLWQHEVAVVVPSVIRSSTAHLHITGGGNAQDGLDRFDFFGTVGPNASDVLGSNSEVGQFAAFAEATGSIFTVLNQVPNQSIQFTNDIRGPRVEDDSIAKTIRNFIDGGAKETDWPLLLPMTKAAVKAMDMTQDFVRNSPASGFSFLGGSFVGSGSSERTPVAQDFIVSGGSKRGWTTWLTAAVDDRVKAIVPIVFDALNLGNQLDNQKAIYGRVDNDLTTPDSSGAQFSGALQPYISSRSPNDPNATADMNLTVEFASPAGQKALGIIDPYAYRDAFTMPKYIVNSAGDEFFAINSSNNYYHNLPGEKYLWYIPNTTHVIPANPDGTSNDQAIAEFLESYTAFYGALKSGEDLPQYNYSILNEGRTIRVEFLNGLLPDDITLWYNNGFNGTPDFRRSGIQNALPGNIRSEWFQWDPADDFYSLSYLGNGVFEATANDTDHWQAFMMQFVYNVDSVPFIDPSNPAAGWRSARFRFSSGVSIVGPEALTPVIRTASLDLGLNALSLDRSSITAVPEASTTLLLGVGGLVLVAFQARRRWQNP
jgi:PhoPQ-activated pathogenicity-related protein